MLPIAAEIAEHLTREHAGSALPDAPIVDDTPPARRPRGQRRAMAAQALRRLADRVEPSAAACSTPTTRLSTLDS
ncbi:MAG: hypothetical protein ACRDOY_06915 [Nocardioidaceae bacterium]